MHKTAVILLASVVAISNTFAAKFIAKPTVVKDGANYKISFAVSEHSDVTVAVANQNGKIVRHIVSGKLGDAPPAPLKPNSLQQELLWDGNDDNGKPVALDGCKVHVGLSLKVAGERIIGQDPLALGAVTGMSVGPKGELYIYTGGRIIVLNRDGTYARQIMPYPYDLPAEKLAGLKPAKSADGKMQPRYWYPHLKFTPNTVGQMAISPDGSMLYLPGQPRYARNLTRIGTDGSVPENAFSTRLTTHADNGYLYLVCSPDGRTLYMSGAQAGYMGDDARVLSYRQSVYRLLLDSDGPAEVFTGDDENSGSNGFSVDTPKGLAVNPEGHLFVCNYGADNIAVYTPGGGFLRQIKIAKPQLVSVNPKSGQLYVICGSESSRHQYGYQYPSVMHDGKLVRLSPSGELELEMPFDPPYTVRRVNQKTKEPFAQPEFNLRLAVDYSDAAKPVIWVGLAHPSPEYAKWGLLRIEDTGEKFSEAVDLNRKRTTMGYLNRMVYDPKSDTIYVSGKSTFFKYNSNGELVGNIPITRDDGTKLNFSIAEFGITADGTICFSAMGSGYRDNFLVRASMDGKEIPFPEGRPKIDHMLKGGDTGSSRGFAVNRRGEMYVMHFVDSPRSGPKAPTEAWDKTCPLPVAIAKYSADGKLLDPHLVGYLRSGAHGLRIDSKDNIYVADNIMPAGVSYPHDITAIMPDNPLTRPYPARLPDATFDRWLQYMGSIFKFGPEGGTIIGAPEETPLVRTANPNPTDLYRPAPENQWFVYGYHNLRVIGAQWQFHGISPTPAQYQGVTHVERCVCTGARFDIDGFDRIVVPDTLRKQMVMLDSNGNVIARYGQYGNYDTPVEQIGLGSPSSVAAGDLCAFIYDDQRVVKVRYSYAAEESINIR